MFFTGYTGNTHCVFTVIRFLKQSYFCEASERIIHSSHKRNQESLLLYEIPFHFMHTFYVKIDRSCESEKKSIPWIYCNEIEQLGPRDYEMDTDTVQLLSQLVRRCVNKSRRITPVSHWTMFISEWSESVDCIPQVVKFYVQRTTKIRE